jgi:hypothetical protein
MYFDVLWPAYKAVCNALRSNSVNSSQKGNYSDPKKKAISMVNWGGHKDPDALMVG